MNPVNDLFDLLQEHHRDLYEQLGAGLGATKLYRISGAYTSADFKDMPYFSDSAVQDALFVSITGKTVTRTFASPEHGEYRHLSNLCSALRVL